MNTTITASSVIDRAISLKEGGVIVIPCSSYEEMEGLRVRFYKLRNQLAKKHSTLATSLDITRKVRKKKWTLYISKERSLQGVLVVENGEATPLVIEAEEEEDESRRKRLMLEDGVLGGVETEDEDKDETEAPTQNFDDVASKIEEAQGLTKED